MITVGLEPELQGLRRKGMTGQVHMIPMCPHTLQTVGRPNSQPPKRLRIYNMMVKEVQVHTMLNIQITLQFSHLVLDSIPALEIKIT